ncbi:MAG: hypothetical protein GKC53_02015 [Neisseriaceae bacterium]|nr:MAG: hypothetical protein GKC53_02015 [Neisseriaceae bacterium]
MNCKKGYILLLGLTILTSVTGCKKNNTVSSISEQDIQLAQTVDDSSQLTVNDTENNQQIIFTTEGIYRTLDNQSLEKYNKQYKSFKTIKYFYNDDKDTSIAVAKVAPLNKSKKDYFSDLEKNVKTIFPQAKYTQGVTNDNQHSYARYSYHDPKNGLNNACDVILMEMTKTLYSICAISPSQSIEFLKEAVKNVSVRALKQ